MVKPSFSDDEFISLLNHFLKEKGRRMVDLAQILGYSLPTQDAQPENLTQGKTEDLQHLNENTWY